MILYLDHNATTPLHPVVLQTMLPYFTEHFGNPDSRSHAYGWQAQAAVTVVRESILKLLHAPQNARLIFTSSATEANNLAIKGIIEATSQKECHIITQVTEHSCVLETCRWLERQGHRVTYLPVDAEGFVDPDALKNVLTPQTCVVSIMLANNEIGTIQNIKELAKITHENSSAFFHTDAVQAIGKMPVSVTELDVDLLSVSAHKIYGPKGVGGLYVGPRVKKSDLVPQMHGGGHEEGMRSGTLNVPGIVGLAKAFEMAMQDLTREPARQQMLRDLLIQELCALGDVSLNGAKDARLCNNANFWIHHVKAESLLLAVPSLAFSTGSACASGKTEPSYVVQALGRSRDAALCSVRFGLGRTTTAGDINEAVALLKAAIVKLR